MHRTDMNAHVECCAFARERSQAYWLLSRLFLQVPDLPCLRELQTLLASADGQGPLGELKREVSAAMETPDEAAVEFTRRLVVVSKDSGESLPFESFVREGMLPGTATAEVAACMADAGLPDAAPDAATPDHIGAEFGFMALLCHEECRAWAENRQEEALRLAGKQWHFLNRHLAAWIPDYCDALEARAAHGYMKAVARLARQCVLADVDGYEGVPDVSEQCAEMR